jgi:mannose-6-phosphate isomerase
LREALRLFPEPLLGRAALGRWGGELPFLFKILSIGEPLSIQAHPDAALARTLHARDPSNYPDPYHKPEVGVAVTPVEMLAGFLPGEELQTNLARYPELRGVIGRESKSAEQVYRSVIEASEDGYRGAVDALQRRLDGSSALAPAERYFLNMAREYGSADRGLLGFFIFNFVTLSPGEGVFIGPNFPHAYLFGEVVECMANSDNVVRAGLTRKFQDKATLLHMLDYTATFPAILGAEQHAVEPGRIRFSPAAEFTLERFFGERGTFAHVASGLSLAVVIRGEVTVRTPRGERDLRAGDVAAIPALEAPCTLELRNGEVYLASIPTAR